ncbi:MAG: S41 family peptidase [Gemmatimonadetes bacterium]|nr:S41 family peptidase [Gemmatimonadota bacterium]
MLTAPGSVTRLALLSVAIAALAAAAPPEPLRFMRDPHIAHGRITFAYQGDIWLANADGSSPRRLIAHPATEISPRFSPDGEWVAFSSDRMGNLDVYVVPVTGGEPRQLTWFTGPDEVEYWTPDGRGIVISTARGSHPFGSPLHIVPLDGGAPGRMDMDFARAGMIRQDGAMVVFTRENKSETRLGYRGNNSADIYVQDMRTKKITQLTDTGLATFREHVQDGHPMWGADGNIYYVSERSGIFNLWRIPPTGGPATQVTQFRSGGVKWPSVSPDGRTLIFTQDYELHVVDIPNGQPRKVPVVAAVDPIENPLELVSSENRADGFAPSPDGGMLAVDFRGEIFLVPAEADMGDKSRVTRSARRDRYPQYSPDGKFVAYISDESGEEEVWVWEVAGGARRQLSNHASYKNQMAWAPDASRIAFVGANRLFELEVASGRQRELAWNIAGGYNLAEYSPDGKWLVYTRSDEDQNADVYLYDIADGREYNATQNPFRDSGGALTSDGRTLVFASARDGGTSHLFAVSLTRLTEDPDDPLVRAQRRPATDSAARGGRGGAQAGGAETAQAAPVRVDPDGIGQRAVQLTSGSNAAGSFFLSRDGRTVYFTSSDSEGPGLFAIGIDGRDRRKVASGNFASLAPSQDRRFVFYRQGGGGPGGGRGGAAGNADIQRMPISGQRPERVTFSLTVEVDRKSEWAQIFDESWRVMKYRFYDENMHDKDWQAIRTRYESMLAHVGSYDGVYELANFMIGELNASHVGVSGPSGRPAPEAYRSRYLGFEMEPADGVYRISHIYRNGPADREWLGVNVGDRVLAIDGREVRAGDNYWKILNEAINEYVPVRVASASGANVREVRIRTLASITDARYEDWVARNREFVEKETGGQIAYLHIRAMNQPSLERFRNEIDRYWNSKGIIVDIRYNGGGNIDQELLDILEREPYQFWNSRWGARTWGRRPRQAIAGPKVLLTNARSGSDSEVTPMGFRQLGLGRIVGNPTAAAVIATGSYALINGGSIRTPGSLVVTYDPTKPNNYGINLENYGVEPDVLVENTPEDELRGFDRELKTAIDEALKMLREGRWQFTTTEGNGR